LWELNLSGARLREIGLQLGADVPFFVFGHNAIGEASASALRGPRVAGGMVSRADAASLGFDEGNV